MIFLRIIYKPYMRYLYDRVYQNSLYSYYIYIIYGVYRSHYLGKMRYYSPILDCTARILCLLLYSLTQGPIS